MTCFFLAPFIFAMIILIFPNTRNVTFIGFLETLLLLLIFNDMIVVFIVVINITLLYFTVFTLPILC